MYDFCQELALEAIRSTDRLTVVLLTILQTFLSLPLHRFFLHVQIAVRFAFFTGSFRAASRSNGPGPVAFRSPDLRTARSVDSVQVQRPYAGRVGGDGDLQRRRRRR